MTVNDVLAASDAAAYVEAVTAWATEAWQAWSAHHETVRGLAHG